jgi:hypothetical protein
MNKAQWKEFDRWFCGHNWQRQKLQIQVLFPRKNWKLLWKQFKELTDLLGEINKENVSWKVQKEVLNILLLEK